MELQFNDVVVTKTIRDTLLYPGLELALSECRQWRSSRGWMMKTGAFTTVTHIGGAQGPFPAVSHISAPAVTPLTTGDIAYASDTLKLSNNCKGTYGITGIRNGLGATQCSNCREAWGWNPLSHLADLPTSGQNFTSGGGGEFQPPT